MNLMSRTILPRRSLESYNPIWLGAIALTLVAAVVGALLLVRAVGLGFTVYRAEFAQAAQLQPGNYISVAGVQVGEVARVGRSGKTVLVDLKVRNDVRLGAHTRAAIKLTTLLGSRYVELRPGGSDPLPDKTIRMSYTEVPYDLQALLEDSTTTFEDLDAEKMATAIGIFAKQLDGLPEALPAAMTNLQSLSGVIAQRRDQLGVLLEATATLTDTLHRQQAGLGQLVFQGRDLLGEFVARRAAFQQLMAGVTRIVGLADKLVVKDRSAFQGLLEDLKELTALMSDNDELFRSLLQVMPLPIRNVANALGSGPGLEFYPTNGLVVDNWMCAISGRAKQFNMVEYFKDCA